MAAVFLLGTSVVGCGPQGTPDPEPRPQTVEEYMAAMDAHAVGDDPRKIPMLLKEQKRLTLEEMGGEADASDFKDAPGKSPEFVARWRETGIAYFNAPFGTVEERRAWEAYMVAINGDHAETPAAVTAPPPGTSPPAASETSPATPPTAPPRSGP